MPFKSKAQQRYLYATHPGIAKRWADEMKRNHKSMKKLPQHKVKHGGMKKWANS